MNVLILSASAKVLLVQSFRQAAAERGGRVVACDTAADSAALYAADEAVLVPRSTAPEFAAAVLELCAGKNIRLVVPTRDAELAALSGCVEALRERGVSLLLPPPRALEICRDKRKFTDFCRTIGLPVARSYAPGEMPTRFPVFARPIAGAGGQGARVLRSAAEVAALGDGASTTIVQDYVDDPEYTIDVLMDLEGRPLQAVARSRLLIRNGESQKSRVEDLPVLSRGALDLCSALGLVGHNVVQAFHSPARGPHYIEVNPRFGGASNLSIAAGLDSPRRILAMVAGEEAEAARARPIRYGLTMLRHSADILVDAATIEALPHTK
ncbi:MAG TPA: ATP-grasp domain-containing protein [Aliidongia sp.]|nr:ATP-grasp domain-containing protein [Aliidongia sp.]